MDSDTMIILSVRAGFVLSNDQQEEVYTVVRFCKTWKEALRRTRELRAAGHCVHLLGGRRPWPAILN